MKRKVKLSDQIRAAVDGSGLSRRQICRATGIDEGAMSRFMAGRVGLSLATLDRLADVLRLRVVARSPETIPPQGRPPPALAKAAISPALGYTAIAQYKVAPAACGLLPTFRIVKRP